MSLNPAYSRALLEQRLDYNNPVYIIVAFSERWHKPEHYDHPLIYIRPSEYKPGKYNLTVLLGCCIHILIDDTEHLSCKRESYYISIKAFQLMDEIARLGAPVYVRNNMSPDAFIRGFQGVLIDHQSDKYSDIKKIISDWDSERLADYKNRIERLDDYVSGNEAPA